jgi:hypothetical protein
VATRARRSVVRRLILLAIVADRIPETFPRLPVDPHSG